MVDIRPLTQFDMDELNRVMPGYSSIERYVVSFSESDDGRHISFDLTLVPLTEPYIKRWDVADERNEDTAAYYARMVEFGLSRGAYDADRLVAIALAEAHLWNQTLWISEFGVAESHRGKGIGQRLMQTMVEVAQEQGLRCLGLETQTSNVAAIRFYRRTGFDFDGIRLSFYSNDDVERGEVALFMRRMLD